MYLAETRTLLWKATKEAFASPVSPDIDFSDIHVSLQYPIQKVDYPAVWVDFEPEGNLTRSGIAHVEYQPSPEPGGGPYTQMARWKFGGNATFTAMAMTALERDRLIDALIQIVAFSGQSEAMGTFRASLHANQLISLAMDFDKIEQRGFGVGAGTPWGTDELIYEGTLSLAVVGEFVSSPDGQLQGLSGFTIIPLQPGETDPTDGGGWIG